MGFCLSGTFPDSIRLSSAVQSPSGSWLSISFSIRSKNAARGGSSGRLPAAFRSEPWRSQRRASSCETFLTKSRPITFQPPHTGQILQHQQVFPGMIGGLTPQWPELHLIGAGFKAGHLLLSVPGIFAIIPPLVVAQRFNQGMTDNLPGGDVKMRSNAGLITGCSPKRQ